MSKEPTHVVQARNELANAKAYGQEDRVRAAEKVLAAAGVTRRAAVEAEEPEPEKARRTPPRGRTAPAAHKSVTAGGGVQGGR
jgi:hypothetical protein